MSFGRQLLVALALAAGFILSSCAGSTSLPPDTTASRRPRSTPTSASIPSGPRTTMRDGEPSGRTLPPELTTTTRREARALLVWFVEPATGRVVPELHLVDPDTNVINALGVDPVSPGLRKAVDVISVLARSSRPFVSLDFTPSVRDPVAREAIARLAAELGFTDVEIDGQPVTLSDSIVAAITIEHPPAGGVIPAGPADVSVSGRTPGGAATVALILRESDVVQSVTATVSAGRYLAELPVPGPGLTGSPARIEVAAGGITRTMPVALS